MSMFLFNPPVRQSWDYYVRLKHVELMQVEFCHFYSEKIGSQSGVLFGLTEWRAQRASGVDLSLAWDWECLNDGDVQLHQPAKVRSNIMLIDAQGYDQGLGNTDLACLDVIGKLRWRRILSDAAIR